MKKLIVTIIVLIVLGTIAWLVSPQNRLTNMSASSSSPSPYSSSNSSTHTSSNKSSRKSSRSSSRRGRKSSKTSSKRPKNTCANPTSNQISKTINANGEGGIGSVALQDATLKANAECEKEKSKKSCDKGCKQTAVGGALPFGAPKYKGEAPNVTVKQEFKCTIVVTCS